MSETADAVFADVEKQYMPTLMKRVKARSVEFAGSDSRNESNYVDVFRAFEAEFGPKPSGSIADGDGSWVRDNLFLLIVVIMTFGFGLMGLAPYLLSLNVDKLGYKPEIFLDIAKIFAGVVVGGAAGAAAGAATSVSRRSRSN